LKGVVEGWVGLGVGIGVFMGFVGVFDDVVDEVVFFGLYGGESVVVIGVVFDLF